MFVINVTVSNPMTGENRVMNYQFDPATMNAAKWDGAFPTVQGKITELVTAAVTSEPPKW